MKETRDYLRWILTQDVRASCFHSTSDVYQVVLIESQSKRETDYRHLLMFGSNESAVHSCAHNVPTRSASCCHRCRPPVCTGWVWSRQQRQQLICIPGKQPTVGRPCVPPQADFFCCLGVNYPLTLASWWQVSFLDCSGGSFDKKLTGYSDVAPFFPRNDSLN